MINEKKLLIEIGTDELPATELHSFSKLLSINLKILLKKHEINFGNIKNFISIRRISFLIILEQLNESVIKNIIEKLLKETKFKSNMRWACHKNTFIRPINWYVLIYGSNLIEHTIFDIKSNFYSEAHRIKKKKIKLKTDDYEHILKKANIIVDQKKRFKIIKNNLIKLSKKCKIKLMIHKDDLIKISNSVEYPKIITCKFNKSFLFLPEKILINNLLEKNCIPIIKKNITNKFIVVVDTYINKLKKIKNGYETCINIKLSESSYFYKQTDNFIKNNKLNDLKKIICHDKLGNLYNKIYRMSYILNNLNINNKIKTIKSIILSKLDVQTKIVSEMPNIKGIISAHNLKIHTDISKILYEYNKIFNNDIPKSDIASIITILEKIDNIVGFFLIGEKAKNKKDPFNLRRDATIIIKTIIKNKLNIHLEKIIQLSLNSYHIINNSQVKKEIIDFILQRLNSYNKNIIEHIKTTDVYKKCLIATAYSKFNLYKINDEIKILIKRINKLKIKNIIKNDYKYNRHVDKNIIKTNLIKIFIKQLKILRILYKKNLYFEYIKTILNLKKYINIFFNKVFILNENKNIKFNNLKIINILNKYLNSLINFKNIN
ncbi:MAG TPA: glycine--tRNA ligase subunit beta [Candidatus Azoamicus sp.]